MSISLEQINKIAKLARLKLKPQEEQKFSEQLNAIVGYIDKLKELEQKEEVFIEEVVHSQEELKEDTADGGRYQQLILENAPDKKDNFVVVPTILEK